MDQQEFIWEMRGNKITQRDDGITTVQLRPQLRILHNFRKRNTMHIVFDDENLRYIIPSKAVLLYLYGVHKQYKNSMQPIKDYCKDNLVKD